MKQQLFFLLLFLCLNIRATEIKGHIQSKNYDQAQTKKSKLVFTVESTKVGIFSSDVDGHVLDFKYVGDLDEKNLILRNMKLSFPAVTMNTDHEDRDQKLHQLCMGAQKYPEVSVSINGPVFLKSSREVPVEGTVMIRGKEKPFKALIKTEVQGNSFLLSIKTTWSLKEMEIPDPSIAVAKLSDDIRINAHIEHSLK